MNKKSIAFKHRKKLFIRFLKENNCYEHFIYSMVNNDNYMFRFNNIDELINFAIVRRFENFFTDSEIYRAFFWSDTIEGNEYWKDINNKWLKIVGNDNYYNLLEIQARING